jgi:hypothetical protein
VYCDCKNKKPLTNEANKTTFTVCAKSQGGCGKEIKERISVLLKEFEDMLEEEYPPTVCPYCDGDGIVRVPFSNPVELDFCSNCSGTGRI